MRIRILKRCWITSLLSLTAFLSLSGEFTATAAKCVIIEPRDASRMEDLAAREVRRYVYLRTGQLLPVRHGQNEKGSAILIGRKDRPFIRDEIAKADGLAALDSLGADGYWLKTAPGKASRLVLAGGNDVGTLYAAYRFAETLSVRFFLHGDVVPDERIKFELPQMDERRGPLFALRGIQPFHDFPEGPDWWNLDDCRAILGQLPKLGMNFFGLHTYPENRPNAEPTVWIGLSRDVGRGGRVDFSYPSSYQNTLRGNWGYAAKKTSEFPLGSALLFDRDGFGPEVMGNSIPAPATPEASNEVFERTAGMLREAFTFARQFGIKTCVGTETPLVVPKLVQDRLRTLGMDPGTIAVRKDLYSGIFRRAAQAYPLDYYWFWTPEDWTWSVVKDEQVKATLDDMNAAIEAHRELHPPFALATCGWVLGPQQDRALFDKSLPKDVAVSCINREVGYTPVEPGFADVKGRSKWAIPWLEDDPALTSPQFWVGRMRRDAADALRYGCDGLMGIHWRTRVLSMNIGALANAAWDQQPWISSYKTQPKAVLPDAGDYYSDWALHQFGPQIAQQSAVIFSKMDGNLPKPSVWTDGPGGVRPDSMPWGQALTNYAFVDDFARLAPLVKGAGNRERYDYWLNTFLYFRAIAEANCLWAEFNQAMEKVKLEKDPGARKERVRSVALPARVRLVGAVSKVYEHLLAHVGNPGELGTVANWSQHNLPVVIDNPGKELEALLGESLPPDAQLGGSYHGPTRVIVPTTPTSLAKGQPLKVIALVLSETPPNRVDVLWRQMGGKRYRSLSLLNVNRGVYAAEIPAGDQDIEYSVKVEVDKGLPVFFPSTAPQMNLTVVRYTP